MTTEEGNKLIAEFMGFPKVTKMSWWDYDRSLDNASMVRGLCVEDINEQGVKFYEKMPYERYGLSFFDGVVFKPIGFKINDNSPNRPYNSSWEWLIPVHRKLTTVGLWMMTNGFDALWLEKSKEIDTAILTDETPEGAAILIADLIQWHNQAKA